MKRTIFIFFIFILSADCFSQYVVTKVIGQVKKMSGELLTTGTQLSDEDVLLFSTPHDMVRVIVAGKGIYVLNPSPKAEKQQNVVLEVIKFTMHVKAKEGYLSGRGESTEKLPACLETDLSLNKKNLICKESRYLFDAQKYDVAGGGRFFLQIETVGAKPVIRPLKTIADTLLLQADDFRIPGTDSLLKATYLLGFFSKQKAASEPVATIDPYLAKAGEMAAIIQVICSQSGPSERSALQQVCYGEVYAALGRPSDIDFAIAFDAAVSKKP